MLKKYTMLLIYVQADNGVIVADDQSQSTFLTVLRLFPTSQKQISREDKGVGWLLT